MSDTSPSKRKLEDMIFMSPTKSTSSRRVVKVFGSVVGDEKRVGFFFCKTDRGDGIEPFTFPARRLVLNEQLQDNPLRKLGILFVLVRVAKPNENVPMTTTRGYGYNLFTLVSDHDLTENNFEQMVFVLKGFCGVSMHQKVKVFFEWCFQSH